MIALLTSVNQRFNRIAIHGVRRELLDQQGKAAGLPLWTIGLPSPCTNAIYEERMLGAFDFLKQLGVEAIAFGDLYLQDIRSYRETRFGNRGLELLFPLWNLPTRELAHEIISAGVKARITCVDPRSVPADWAGREYDERLLAELPASVDPCAENGEFHTFVYSGPMFKSAIDIVPGETVQREGFVYADLLPAGMAQTEKSAGPALLAG